MKPNWVPVKEFVKGRKKDITITMEVPDGDYERYRQQFPSMRKTVKCRMVKVLAENGEEQILCTSLLDPVKYKLQELGELYRVRWGIEEGYKMYKAMMMTMCAALAFPIEERVYKEYNEGKKKDWSNICARSTAPSPIGRPEVY